MSENNSSDICPQYMKDKFNSIPNTEGAQKDQYMFNQEVHRLKDEVLANSKDKLTMLKDRFQRSRQRIGRVRKFAAHHNLKF